MTKRADGGVLSRALRYGAVCAAFSMQSDDVRPGAARANTKPVAAG